MTIPKEVLDKYYMADISEYESEAVFYETFLIQTDHIPNKIIEQLVENLATASAFDFVSVFVQFIKDIKVNYNDILSYRKFAREEINRLEEDDETE